MNFNFSTATLLVISIVFSAPVKAWSDPANGEILEKAPLLLGQGEQRLLKLPGLSRYSVGSSTIRIHPLGTDQLLVKGVSPGNSDLWIWKLDGNAEHRPIRVEKLAAGELKPGLAKALGALEEAQVQLTGSGVVLRGVIQSAEELARILALAESFPGELRDETEPSSRLLAAGEEKLSRWLAQSRLTDKLRLERRQGSLALVGAIERTGEKSALRRKARALFPAVVLELETLPDDSPTVHFKVFLLELKRDRMHSLGLSWPAIQEGAFRVTSTGIADLLQLDLALQALEGEGSLKILSNPELVVRAPGEAELFSGGELPIQNQGRFHASVTWKNFGLMLKLKVTHTTATRVRLDISTEVSHLDPSIASNAVPGIQANRLRTQVDARYGSPLLLSGLLQQGTRKSARGLPLLRQLPVLGALFGSEEYLNEKSELVAVLQPSLAPPPPPMHRLESTGPRGPVPAPRNWLTPAQERELRADPSFPWNVLSEEARESRS
ncbi:MAG: type II and III secretion system protein [Oligoflexia bacterium]|nr:type II and III secretion system protein [Oligoflexia bacterium]